MSSSGGGIVVRANGLAPGAGEAQISKSDGQTIADSLTAQGHPLLAAIIQAVVNAAS